jgi:hypothetical protein
MNLAADDSEGQARVAAFLQGLRQRRRPCPPNRPEPKCWRWPTYATLWRLSRTMAAIFRKQVSRQRATSSSAATAYDRICQELTAQLSRLLTKSFGRSVPLGAAKLSEQLLSDSRDWVSAEQAVSSSQRQVSQIRGRQPYSIVRKIHYANTRINGERDGIYNHVNRCFLDNGSRSTRPWTQLIEAKFARLRV